MKLSKIFFILKRRDWTKSNKKLIFFWNEYRTFGDALKKFGYRTWAWVPHLGLLVT